MNKFWIVLVGLLALVGCRTEKQVVVEERATEHFETAMSRELTDSILCRLNLRIDSLGMIKRNDRGDTIEIVMRGVDLTGIGSRQTREVATVEVADTVATEAKVEACDQRRVAGNPITEFGRGLMIFAVGIILLALIVRYFRKKCYL